LDSDEKYLFDIESFLEDIGWLEQEPNGEYVVTNRRIIQGHGKAQIRLQELLHLSRESIDG
jgi:hypothetical protein